MVTALPAPAAQKVSPRNFEAKLQPRARMAAVIGKTRKTVVLPRFYRNGQSYGSNGAAVVGLSFQSKFYDGVTVA